MKNTERQMEVIVLEDEPLERQALTEQIDACAELHLAFATDNAEEALSTINSFCPDAVILDLELHKGHGDGFEFLSAVKSLNLKKPPFLLVTTWNISSTTHNAARELGADYILTKTSKDYSAKMPVDFLVSLKSVIFSRQTKKPVENAALETSDRQKQIIRRIMAELNKIGINPKSVGYNYLIDAIQIIMVENKPHICQEIGKKWKKAENSVERAIQNAINRAWNTADAQDLIENYTACIKSERGVPTVNEFIHYYANKIKLDFNL